MLSTFWSGMLESIATVSGGHLFALSAALVLSTAIGFEREWNMKDAGLRTHVLVGVGSALFMLVSKYGFSDLWGAGLRYDPGRIAAQVVSGIGFIGGGLIFVRRDIVRGLAAAAAVWLTAAVGLACGVGMAGLACYVTLLYFVVVLGYSTFSRNVIDKQIELEVVFEPHKQVMTHIMNVCASWGFYIRFQGETKSLDGGMVSVRANVSGRRDLHSLMVSLQDIAHVQSVAMLPRTTSKSLRPRALE